MKENWHVETIGTIGLYIVVSNYPNLNLVSNSGYANEPFSMKETCTDYAIGRWKPKTIKQ